MELTDQKKKKTLGAFEILQFIFTLPNLVSKNIEMVIKKMDVFSLFLKFLKNYLKFFVAKLF